MITVQDDDGGSGDEEGVTVEFDEYVPLTLTWPAYRRLLDKPLEVRMVSDGRLLELKFHPETRALVEVVLVGAPAVTDEGEAPAWPAPDSPATARWEGGGEVPDPFGSFRVVARLDHLEIAIATGAVAQWRGAGTVRFGDDGSQGLAALGVAWTPAQREEFLATVE